MGYFDSMRLPFFRLHKCWQCGGTGVALVEVTFVYGVVDMQDQCDLCEGRGRITAEQMSWRDNPPNDPDDVGWA